MDNNTCSKTYCPNWGILVIDANVVIYILAASIAIVGEKSVNPTWPLRIPEALKVFKGNLQKVKRCSCNGQLYFSEPVLREELDAGSLRRGASPAGQSCSIYNIGELEAFHQVVCNCFNSPIIILGNEITELRSILSSQGVHLDDNDASLFLAACKVSQPGMPTLIISQDGHFEEPVGILAKMRNFSIQGMHYPTTHITWRTYLSYITTAHDCCLYLSEIYERLYNAWCYTIPKRVAGAKKQQLAMRLQEQFIFSLPVMQKSVEYKNR